MVILTSKICSLLLLVHSLPLTPPHIPLNHTMQQEWLSGIFNLNQ